MWGPSEGRPTCDSMVEIEPVWIVWPHARIRRIFETDGGSISRFVVQLEYDVAADMETESPPSWRVVARFDHDASSVGGHDVSEEGLHLDVYRDDERYARARNFPRLPPGSAMRFAENHLRRHADLLLARFERWHDLAPKGPD